MIIVLAKIILFLMVLLIRKKIGEKSSDVLSNTDWLRFIFFPIFTIFTIIALIITSGSIENQKQESVFLVIALCLAGMNIVVFYLINDILKREIKIRENKIFQLKLKIKQRCIDLFPKILLNSGKEHMSIKIRLCVSNL